MFVLLLIFLFSAVGIYLGYPMLFPEKPVMDSVIENNTSASVSTVNYPESPKETVQKEKTKLSIEIEQRELGYEDKLFTYEPYIAPSNRNPFEKIRNLYASAEYVSEENEDDSAQGNKIILVRPELPSDTRLSGIMGSNEKRIAIMEIEGEIYIAKEYDILSDRFIVKEIKEDEVVIDFNGYFFSLKVGGENLSDEL